MASARLDRLRAYLEAMQTERVALVWLGDSNIVRSADSGFVQGFGWGIADASAGDAYCYGSGLRTQNGKLYDDGATSQNNHTDFQDGTITDDTGAPSWCEDYCPPPTFDGLSPLRYAYRPTGAGASGNRGAGIYARIEASNPGWPSKLFVDTDGIFRYQFRYAKFATNGGSTYPTIRLSGPGYTILYGNEIEHFTGGDSMATDYRLVGADASRDSKVEGRWSRPSPSWPVTGEAFFTWEAVDNPGRLSGFSNSCMMAEAGEGLRYYADALQTATDETLIDYFSFVRESIIGGAAGQTERKIVIGIHSGLNDRNDSELSLGPSPAQGKTRAGFKDNLDAIKIRIDEIFDGEGWDTDELLYLVYTSHNPSGVLGDDAQMPVLRQGAVDFAEAHDNACAKDPNDEWTGDLIQAAEYYEDYPTLPSSHLTKEGYRALATSAIESAMTAEPPAEGGDSIIYAGDIEAGTVQAGEVYAGDVLL